VGKNQEETIQPQPTWDDAVRFLGLRDVLEPAVPLQSVL